MPFPFLFVFSIVFGAVVDSPPPQTQPPFPSISASPLDGPQRPPGAQGARPRTVPDTSHWFVPQMDLDGLPIFWSIADALSRREAPGAAWDSLFATPGYHLLVNRYPLDHPLRTSIELTFDPRRDAERQRVAASRVWMKPRMLRHLQRIKEHRDALTAYAQSLAEDDSLLQDAVAELIPHLPEGTLHDRFPPTVSFVLFLDEGYAGADVVAIDLLLARSLGRNRLVRFIAHELFHVYRAGLTRSVSDRAPRSVQMVVGALEQLENEGIADRIDKPEFLAERFASSVSEADRPSPPHRGTAEKPSSVQRFFDDYAADYREEYARATATLAEIDQLLARIESEGRISPRVLRRLQRTIPMGGHPTGAHMADLIARTDGLACLRATVGNVFSFFRAYHDAARRSASQGGTAKPGGDLGSSPAPSDSVASPPPEPERSTGRELDAIGDPGSGHVFSPEALRALSQIEDAVRTSRVPTPPGSCSTDDRE